MSRFMSVSGENTGREGPSGQGVFNRGMTRSDARLQSPPAAIGAETQAVWPVYPSHLAW